MDDLVAEGQVHQYGTTFDMNEGKIMVTLERLQPVFHVTVARRF